MLVDFEKSILDRSSIVKTAGESLIPRSGNKYDAIKKIFLGRGKKTESNTRLFLQSLKESNQPNPTILIIGGGAKGNGTSLLYESADNNFLTFDIYASSNTDFVADGHNLPISNSSIDAVWIQAVLEHVLYPQQVVSEIYRVLKDGGIVYAETPFLQHVHEGAYDFTRFTESGHRLLFRQFKLIDSGFLNGIGTVLLWNLRYFFWGLLRNKKAAIAITLLFGWLRFFDHLVPKNFNVDAASGVYFLGKKDPNFKFSDRDIIKHYQGYQN
ncbi:methyltransferase domain-containing protein [Dyadobacter aurulentus]|uniref:methyltransferase domain-containing protein n=1 Tax=Dyadobacter sp. UC 10 TaxID=2605428 RepID=UPI001CEE05DB|nr:class I SAM-dependent methyltransferase [Dyadobacter sp. UC 10]